MLGSIGMPELILIFIVALIVFGPKKLPEIGKSLGKGLAEFKRASDDLRQNIQKEVNSLEQEARLETPKEAPREAPRDAPVPADSPKDAEIKPS